MHDFAEAWRDDLLARYAAHKYLVETRLYDWVCFCKILYSNADRLFRFGCSFSHTSSWLHRRLPSGCVFIPSLFSRQQAYPPSHFRFFQRFPAVAPNPFNANLRKKEETKRRKACGRLRYDTSESNCSSESPRYSSAKFRIRNHPPFPQFWP